IPLPLVGKGEQNSVKIKLAIEAADKCEVLLMEEPENHLTHANLNKLIQHTADKSAGRQLILTTHSSFVLNKLGVDHVQMFNGQSAITLNDLSKSTKAYFKELPGYDTLRMILSKRSILVEGPSDELIVQKAYYQTHEKLPLEDEVEVISVDSLAFKRFLDIRRRSPGQKTPPAGEIKAGPPGLHPARTPPPRTGYGGDGRGGLGPRIVRRRARGEARCRALPSR
ncbi:MAG: AAA family ATPase, partial [bacterium]